MSKYINVDKAFAEVDKGDLLVGNNAEWAKEIIDRTPREDVAPVVHGFWKGFTHSHYMGIDDDGEPIWRDGAIYYCSICNYRSIIKHKFCPGCGAKMDKENIYE